MDSQAGRAPVSGIVLAAGLSRRFGSAKQLAQVDGRALVRIAAECACRSRLAEVLLVVGHEADTVRAAVAGLPVRTVFNPAYAVGQSTSIRAGLACVANSSEAAMFIPADQPGLTPSALDALLHAAEQHPGAIVVPVHGGHRGAPVTIPRALFGELERLEGDTGGRVLLARHPDRVVEVPLDSPRALVDIDTPADLDALA
jgi:molybdenum cofactor cytidylyltransferase